MCVCESVRVFARARVRVHVNVLIDNLARAPVY